MNAATLNRQDFAAGGMVSLRATGGSKTYSPKSRFGPVGLAVMVGAHLLLGYALATGLAGEAIEIIKKHKPLSATIIQEVKPPPPPPPPPKIEKPKELPKPLVPPPPAYVPPPEVVPVAAPAPKAITAVQVERPALPPPPAPPAPTPAAPTHADIAIACPRQSRPEIPARALDDGLSGVVKAELHIRAGKVVSVQILSGPKVFHAAVRMAASRYECVSGDGEVVATQDFAFKVE